MKRSLRLSGLSSPEGYDTPTIVSPTPPQFVVLIELAGRGDGPFGRYCGGTETSIHSDSMGGGRASRSCASGGARGIRSFAIVDRSPNVRRLLAALRQRARSGCKIRLSGRRRCLKDVDHPLNVRHPPRILAQEVVGNEEIQDEPLRPVEPCGKATIAWATHEPAPL